MKRIISSFFVLMALVVLLVGRVLPHHHHVTYVADNITPIAVTCLGVHCHNADACNHSECTHHDHDESLCLDSDNILFEQHSGNKKIVYGTQIPILFVLSVPEYTIYKKYFSHKFQVYLYPKIPDETSLLFSLRAPPASNIGQILV